MNLHSSKIRSAFFIIVCATFVAGGVIFVAQLDRNALRESGTYSAGRNELTVDATVVDDQNFWASRLKKFTIGTDDLMAIQFVNPHKSYLATADKVLSLEFKEATIGHQKLDLPKDFDGEISSIFFSDSSGWIVGSKTPADILDTQGFKSFVIRSVNGEQVQQRSAAQEWARIVFLDDHEGWIVGGALAKSEPMARSFLALHTTDRGEHWADVSAGLHRFGDGRIEDIHTDGSRVMVVTSDRNVLSTTDAGNNWALLGRIEGEPPQLVMQRIGSLSNGQPWVLGSTGGREGTWSMLAVKTNNNIWVKHKIDRILLKDALFLSDNVAIACGVSPSNNKRPLLEDDHRAGVILRTSDGGRSWTVVYRDPNVQSFNAITAQGNNIWAVGDEGLVIRLRDAMLPEPLERAKSTPQDLAKAGAADLHVRSSAGDEANQAKRRQTGLGQVEDGDSPQRADVFDPLPKQTREEFVKRLNLLLDYRRTERWDGLYELISSEFIRGRSRERFVEDYTNHPGVVGKNTKLINFSPKETTSDSYVPGGFIVYGCAQLSGLRFPVDAHVLATRENGDWRFSDIGMFVPRDTAFKPCGYLSQSAGNLKPKARP